MPITAAYPSLLARDMSILVILVHSVPPHVPADLAGLSAAFMSGVGADAGSVTPAEKLTETGILAQELVNEC
jgi:hypothetical protein